jgi:soluble lytic murein transglycosylase
VKSFVQKLAAIFILLGSLVASLPSAMAVDLPPARLRELAAHADSQNSWPRLRQYAATETNQEWRGWAYFVAGYQEFQQQLFPQAAEDLNLAEQSGFSLADYATYYQASSLNSSGRPNDAAAALDDFATHFSQSRLRDQVLTLEADALLKSHQPEKAVDLLSAGTAAHKQPALALLLANAYLESGRLAEAAASFQNLYYKLPLSPQAKDGGESLVSLQTRMGTEFPAPLTEWKTARADTLARGGRYADALDEYRSLLKDEPTNPAAPQWQIDEARCLWELERSTEALEELPARFDSPELESQRLTLLVRISAQRADAAAVAENLAQIEASNPNSPALAEALSAAGMFYYRQLDWQQAALNYRRLWEEFPQDTRLHEDAWRLAWCDYLLGDANTAEVMHKFLMQFPDSARAPAALYWLGQVEEDRGNVPEARALFALLVKRFPNTYYGPHAAAHLATLRTKPTGENDHPDSGDAPLAASLIPALPAASVPPGIACVQVDPSDAAGPAIIMDSLNLPGLEQDFLKAAITGDNPPVDLHLLLAGTYASQGNAASALFAALRTVPGYSQMEFSDLPKEAWDFLYPRGYLDLIERQARANNVDPFLVMGLIRQESAYNPKALSPANARGLMQLLPKTAAETAHTSHVRSTGQRLYDPNFNVKVGCAYLAQLLIEFDGQAEFAVAAYNAGDFRVKQWMKQYTFRDQAVFLESIPIPATRNYVELVLRDAEVYRKLTSSAPQFAQCPPAPTTN